MRSCIGQLNSTDRKMYVSMDGMIEGTALIQYDQNSILYLHDSLWSVGRRYFAGTLE